MNLQIIMAKDEKTKDIEEAQQEYAQGQCQSATPQQLMEEILA